MVRTSQWGVAYLGWWVFKAVVQSPGVPFLAAVGFGRDFLYIAIFLPLAVAGLAKRDHLIGFGLTLGIGAGIYAAGQIASQLGHVDVSWLIHVTKTADFEGVVRIYAPMKDLLIAAFPIAFAGALIGPQRWRGWFALLASLAGLADALSFTRAVYVSEVLALAVVSLIWSARSSRVRRLLAAVVVLICISIGVGAASNSAESSSSPLQAVVTRAEQGLTNAQDQNGSVGYRLRQSNREIEVLGDHWLTGLGFLAPAYHYFYGLREGSIRDSDLGSLGIIMTMGIIGLILAYMPALAGLGYLLKRRRGPVPYGGAMYLVAAIVGSLTLGAFASTSGVLVLGSTLALSLNWSALDQPNDPNHIKLS
jgi:O-Antigen ligase